MFVCGLDEPQHVGVGQHHAAGVLAAGQAFKARPEGIAVGDSIIKRRGQFQRGAQTGAGPVDGRRRDPFADETVTPMAQIVHGQQRDRLGCERGSQMSAHAIRVLCIGAAAFEIALIAVKRFADRDRAVRIIGAGLTARQRPRHIDGLPVAQNVLTVRWFQIVGQSDLLDPVCTSSDAAYGPRAAAGVAPVAQAGCRARSSPNTASGVPPSDGEQSQFRVCRRAASASGQSRVPCKCPKDRRTLAWTTLDRYGRSCDFPTSSAVQESPQGSTELRNLLHRGGFRPGAALPSPALPPDPCSELLAARSSCLAGGVPDLPSPRLRAAAAGRHSPLRLQDRL